MIGSEPKVGLANLNQSEMAPSSERMLQCASKPLDTADIVRDGDLSPTIAGQRQQRTHIRFRSHPTEL